MMVGNAGTVTLELMANKCNKNKNISIRPRDKLVVSGGGSREGASGS